MIEQVPAAATTSEWDLHVPLTENDRNILEAMLELRATMAKPETAETIVQTALHSGDTKAAFKRLKLNKLVESKDGRAGGYWLTPKGSSLARELQYRDTESPTD